MGRAQLHRCRTGAQKDSRSTKPSRFWIVTIPHILGQESRHFMPIRDNYILCSESSCSTISGLLGLQTIDSGHLPHSSKEGQDSNLSATHPFDGRPQVRLIIDGMTSHNTRRICGARKRQRSAYGPDWHGALLVHRALWVHGALK